MVVNSNLSQANTDRCHKPTNAVLLYNRQEAALRLMRSLLERGPQRKRRHRTRKAAAECFLPCHHVTAMVGVMALVLWMRLLHEAISYDPNTQTTNSFDVLPDPIFPPDLESIAKNHNGAVTPSQRTTNTPLMITWQSNQHAQNQDRAVYYPTFPNRQQQEAAQPTFLVGLFDGHGRDGHLMADFVVQHLGPTLAAKLNARPCCQSDDWIRAALNATFFDLEAAAVELAAQGGLDFAYTGGCTASVTLRLGSKLYFANAGDSRTMLASDFTRHEESSFQPKEDKDPYNVTIRYSTRLDKANLPDERARITRMGGKIHDPPPDSSSSFQPSRVVVTSTHLHDTGALAMSRSLGDVEWTAVGVTPEPMVDVVMLDGPELANMDKPYLIVASDGMWDWRARRPQFFAKRLGNILFDKDEQDTARSDRVVDFLKEITPKKPQFYRDDITVIAFPL